MKTSRLVWLVMVVVLLAVSAGSGAQPVSAFSGYVKSECSNEQGFTVTFEADHHAFTVVCGERRRGDGQLFFAGEEMESDDYLSQSRNVSVRLAPASSISVEIMDAFVDGDVVASPHTGNGSCYYDAYMKWNGDVLVVKMNSARPGCESATDSEPKESKPNTLRMSLDSMRITVTYPTPPAA